MKPRTDIEKTFLNLSKKLPVLTPNHKDWAFKNCFRPMGTQSKKGITCFMCGQTFEDKQPPLLTSLDGAICPHCNTQLEVVKSRKQSFRQHDYFSIIGVKNGWQYIRYFLADITFKKDGSTFWSYDEVGQFWWDKKGKRHTVAKYLDGYNYKFSHDVWHGGLELRNNSKLELPNSSVFPTKRYNNEVLRTGFKGDFYGYRPYRIFDTILTDNRGETLLKSNLNNLVPYILNKTDFSDYWPSIKICLRNNYKISEPNLWFDYIGFLKYFGKDLRNPHYVCPDDLHTAHNYWMRKKDKRKEELNEQEEQRLNQKYMRSKQPYLGIVIAENDFEIRVLNTLKEFAEEGKFMHHCVNSSNYYNKKKSVILSASRNGEKLETVEFDLERMEVIQCHGKWNKNTQYHDEIIRIVNDNKFRFDIHSNNIKKTA